MVLSTSSIRIMIAWNPPSIRHLQNIDKFLLQRSACLNISSKDNCVWPALMDGVDQMLELSMQVDARHFAPPQRSAASQRHSANPHYQKMCLIPATTPVWFTPGATVPPFTTPSVEAPLLSMYDALK